MVDVLMLHDLDVALEVVDDWCEVSRPGKEDVRNCAHVSIDDLINTIDAWSLLVSVQREAMLNGVDSEMSRDAAEAEDWEVLVPTERRDVAHNRPK